jgi:hypothetical protein
VSTVGLSFASTPHMHNRSEHPKTVSSSDSSDDSSGMSVYLDLKAENVTLVNRFLIGK